MRDEDVPADAALLLAVANSLDERSFTLHGEEHAGAEELSSVTAAARLLRENGLISKNAALRSTELNGLVQLRDALRRALAAGNGRHDTTALKEFNALLGTLPLVIQLDSDGAPHLRAETRGVIGTLSEVIARLATSGEWGRLRMCAAHDCRWVFYDTSRNGRGRWCSMKVCGNRNKTRRYRQRHAGTASSAD